MDLSRYVTFRKQAYAALAPSALSTPLQAKIERVHSWACMVQEGFPMKDRPHAHALLAAPLQRLQMLLMILTLQLNLNSRACIYSNGHLQNRMRDAAWWALWRRQHRLCQMPVQLIVGSSIRSWKNFDPAVLLRSLCTADALHDSWDFACKFTLSAKAPRLMSLISLIQEAGFLGLHDLALAIVLEALCKCHQATRTAKVHYPSISQKRFSRSLINKEGKKLAMASTTDFISCCNTLE